MSPDRGIVNDIAAARAKRAETLAQEVVGLNEVKARRLVNKYGCVSRVIKPGMLYTQDIRADRICMRLKDDIVVEAYIG